MVYFFQMLHKISHLEKARHSPHVAQKRRARIRRILQTTLEIVSRDGRESLTLKRVAEQEGLTTAALYRYFASKDALVAGLQRALISALADLTRRHVEKAERWAADEGLGEKDQALLAVVVSGFVFEEFSRAAQVEFGILSSDLSSPEHSLSDREAGRVFDTAWEALSDLAARLRLGEESGALRAGEPSERAVALWAGLQGVVQTRKLSRGAPERIDLTRVAKGLVAALLVGWGAEEEAVNRMVELTDKHGFAALGESSMVISEQQQG
jgi:AcrR family transcriptional regulator